MNPLWPGMIALGALLGAASAVFLANGWKARRLDEPPTAPSAVTRFVIGLALAGVAYHLIAWATPHGWLPLQVPPPRWWLVPTVAGAAVGGSFLADRLDH